MGTSGAYGGSGGAWGGSGVNDFLNDPNEDTAAELAGDALDALGAERDQEAEQEYPPQVIHPPDDVPGASAVPGLRVRGARGLGSGGAGGGAAGGSGGSGRGGGASRSRSRAARAGGRAIAAGFALARGDEATLRGLGLVLAELQGLSASDQMKRILDVTIPASGSPHDAVIRLASYAALVALSKDQETDPRSVVQAFVVEYTFEALIIEVGDRLRQAEPNGSRAKNNETLLKNAIRAYAEQIEVPETGITADDFQRAIETLMSKAQALVSG